MKLKTNKALTILHKFLVSINHTWTRTVKSCLIGTQLIRAPYYDGQFALSQEKKAFTFSLNSTCLIRTHTLLVPIVTNSNFLLTISIYFHEMRLWELIKWSPKRKYFDLLSNSLNLFLKEMYRDQFEEFVCGYWGLKGKFRHFPWPPQCLY